MLWFVTNLITTLGCNRSSNTPLREIRAHTLNMEGVAHAIGLKHAERYCKNCHGNQLSGGQDFIPSCYSCHGKNWLDDNPETIHADRDHSANQNNYLHHPDLLTPLSTCTSCHGLQLEGHEILGRPSCFLCHDKIWD